MASATAALLLLWSGALGALADDSTNLNNTDARRLLKYVRDPPGDDESRCGICPVYIQKICGFDPITSSTYIFDNRCILNLYNCIKGASFQAYNYEKCLYFGNLAYVHGFKWEDKDYGDESVLIRNVKSHPLEFEYDNN